MNGKKEKNDKKLSEFYYICKNKQVKVEEWLSHNSSIVDSSVSIDSPTFPGYTALHFAVIGNNFRAIKLLLKHGADVTIKNVGGQTALHCAMTILLTKAHKKKHKLGPIIDEILDAHKSHYINVFDNMGLSHFHIACFRNNESIVQSFIQNKIDLNSCISPSSSYWPGYTALHITSRYGIDRIAKLLYHCGANVNMKNAAGLTPLHIAIKNHNGLITELLFSALGQDTINPIDNDGISLLHSYCMDNYTSNSFKNILQEKNEVNISIKPDSALWPGYTPLHVAVHSKCLSSIKLLLQHRANFNVKDVNDVSPFQLAIHKKVINNNFIYYIHENIKEKFKADKYSLQKLEYFCACMSSNLDSIKFFLSSGFGINTAMPPDYGINLSGYTALHFAVELGSTEMIDFLLANGADLFAQDINQMTPLHLAVYKKDYSIVTKMFSYYNGVIKNPVDIKGLSHFHIACLDNRTVIVKDILASGATVDMLTYIGETPLHFAVKFNHVNIVKVLLDEGADFTLQDMKTGSTPLHIAAQNKNQKVMSMILSVHHRKIINPVNNAGLSHFHIICMNNETTLIDEFLKNQIASDTPVKLDSPIHPGFTPLHFAVKYSCVKSVRLLLHNNFDTATKDIFNKVPLCYIDKLRPSESKQMLDALWLVVKNNNEKFTYETGLTALHIACMRDDSLFVENLLHQGFNVNARSNERCPRYPALSPLHLAVKYNNVPVVELLLRNHADVNISDKYGFTPLHLACSNSRIKIIEILLAHYADPTAKSARGLTPLRLAIQSKNEKIVRTIISQPTSKLINPMDNKGLTYLHIACLRGMAEIVEEYIDDGADLNETVHPFAPKYSGYTPLHIAVHRKNHQLIDLILRHCTKINIRDSEGCTPLHLTCTSRFAYSDIASKLLTHGADPDARNSLSETLIELAVKHDKLKILKVALKHNADPNLISTSSKNYRPIELAMSLQRERSVELLLNNGADVQFQTVEGGSLIHQTIQLAQQADGDYYVRMFVRLMEHGCDLNAMDNTGRTALHHTYWPCNLAAIKALLRCGVDVNVEDRSGRTIISYFFEFTTSRMPRLELCQIFRKHLEVIEFSGFPLGLTNKLLQQRLLEENENDNFMELEMDEREKSENDLTKECEMEIQRMKNKHFGGYVSLYEMFKNVVKMAKHLARNGALTEFLKSNRFFELFPLCSCLIMMQYGKALTRKHLLLLALEALNTLISENFNELLWKMECSEDVMDYLDNADLYNLIVATRMR